MSGEVEKSGKTPRISRMVPRSTGKDKIQLCDVKRRICLAKPVSVSRDSYLGLLTRPRRRSSKSVLSLFKTATTINRTPMISSKAFKSMPKTVKLIEKYWDKGYVKKFHRRLHRMISVVNKLSADPVANRVAMEALVKKLERYSGVLVNYVKFDERIKDIKRMFDSMPPQWRKAAEDLRYKDNSFYELKRIIDYAFHEHSGPEEGPDGELMFGQQDAAVLLDYWWEQIDKLPRYVAAIQKKFTSSPGYAKFAKKVMKAQREAAARQRAALKRLKLGAKIVAALRSKDPNRRGWALKQLEKRLSKMKPEELLALGLMFNGSSRTGLMAMYNEYLGRVTKLGLEHTKGRGTAWQHDADVVRRRKGALLEGSSAWAMKTYRSKGPLSFTARQRYFVFPPSRGADRLKLARAGSARMQHRMLGMMRAVVASARFKSGSSFVTNRRGRKLVVVQTSDLNWRNRGKKDFITKSGVSMARVNGQWFASSDPLRGYDPDLRSHATLTLLGQGNSTGKVQGESDLRLRRLELIATALYEMDRAVVSEPMVRAAEQIAKLDSKQKGRMDAIVKEMRTLPPEKLLTYMVDIKPELETSLTLVKIDEQKREIRKLMENGYESLMVSSEVDKRSAWLALRELDKARAHVLKIQKIYRRYRGKQMPKSALNELGVAAVKLKKRLNDVQGYVRLMMRPVQEKAARNAKVIAIGITLVAIAASMGAAAAAAPALGAAVGYGTLAYKVGILTVSALAFTAAEKLGQSAVFNQEITLGEFAEDFGENFVMFAFFGWFMKAVGAGLGKLAGKELASKVGRQLLRNAGKPVTAEAALEAGTKWLEKAGFMQRQLAKYGFVKGKGIQSFMRSMGKWGAELGAEVAAFKLWETANLLRRAAGLSTRPIDSKTLRRELRHSWGTGYGWAETGAMVGGLKVWSAVLSKAQRPLVEGYVTKLVGEYNMDMQLLNSARIPQTTRVEVARRQARRMRKLEVFELNIPEADRKLVDGYNVGGTYDISNRERVWGEAELILNVEDKAAFRGALDHAVSEGNVDHREMVYLRRSFALHHASVLVGGKGLSGPRLWYTNRILAKIGSYRIDPKTDSITARTRTAGALRTLWTLMKRYAPRPVGLGGGFIPGFEMGDGSPRKREPLVQLSFADGQGVMRSVLDLWFDPQYQDSLKGLNRAERVELFKAFAQGLEKENGPVFRSISHRGITFDFFYPNGKKDAITGEIRLHFPPANNGPRPDTPVIDITFKAPWNENKPVTVQLKFGWQSAKELHKGFGFVHNGSARSGDHSFKTHADWFNFVIKRVVPILIRSKFAAKKIGESSVQYEFESANGHGSLDGRRVKVVLERNGSRSGVQAFSWVTAFPIDCTAPRPQPKSNGSKAVRPSPDNLMENWSRFDRSIRKNGGDAYEISWNSEPFRRAMGRNANDVIWTWTDKGAREGQVVHARKNGGRQVPDTDLAPELLDAAFYIDLAIDQFKSPDEALGRAYDEAGRSQWIKKLEFYKKHVLPRMTKTQLDWFNTYFFEQLDNLVQTSESQPSHVAGEVVIPGMRKLFNDSLLPMGETVEGIDLYPIVFTEGR